MEGSCSAIGQLYESYGLFFTDAKHFQLTQFLYGYQNLQVWQNYTCKVDDSGMCRTPGRVTPYFYQELASAVQEIYALQHYTPPLLSLQDCNFVRNTFQNITSNHCPPLVHYLKIVNVGLGLISAGVLLCLVLWALYANRPRREEEFVKLSLPIKCISRIQKKNASENGNNHGSTPMPSPTPNTSTDA